MSEQMYLVGKIVNTHGLRGEVKVKRTTDFDDRFKIGNTLYAVDAHNGRVIPLVVKQHRVHKQMDIIQFEDYLNIEDVEFLKGYDLKITAEQQTELPPDEFYYHEIIGCNMVTTNGEKLGKITSILSPGANDVWVVTSEEGQELFIPAIQDVIQNVNIAEKKITIELMEGMLE